MVFRGGNKGVPLQAIVNSLQLLYSSITPYESWDAGMARHLQLGSSFIKFWCIDVHDIVLTISDVWPWWVFWSVRNQIEYCLRTLADIFHGHRVEYTIPPSLKWLISMDKHQKIMFLTWRSCHTNITVKQKYAIPHSIFLGTTAEVFSIVIVITLMLYDFIYYVPQLNRWSFPLVRNHLHISSLLGSVPS